MSVGCADHVDQPGTRIEDISQSRRQVTWCLATDRVTAASTGDLGVRDSAELISRCRAPKLHSLSILLIAEHANIDDNHDHRHVAMNHRFDFPPSCAPP